MPRVDIDLAELQARQLPHLDPEKITIRNTPHADAIRQYLRDNVHLYADPIAKDGRFVCLACGAPINHSFQWGLVHGTGNCSDCTWPYRLYHYVDVGQRHDLRFEALLGYHPDQMSEKDDS